MAVGHCTFHTVRNLDRVGRAHERPDMHRKMHTFFRLRTDSPRALGTWRTQTLNPWSPCRYLLTWIPRASYSYARRSTSDSSARGELVHLRGLGVQVVRLLVLVNAPVHMLHVQVLELLSLQLFVLAPACGHDFGFGFPYCP